MNATFAVSDGERQPIDGDHRVRVRCEEVSYARAEPAVRRATNVETFGHIPELDRGGGTHRDHPCRPPEPGETGRPSGRLRKGGRNAEISALPALCDGLEGQVTTCGSERFLNDDRAESHDEHT